MAGWRVAKNAEYHAILIRDRWHTKAEHFTAWDSLPLHHVIPTRGEEAFVFTRTLCGVELRHEVSRDRFGEFRDEWRDGTNVTCETCLLRMS